MLTFAQLVATCLALTQADPSAVIPTALDPNVDAAISTTVKPPAAEPMIAIIIDDVGYQGRLGEAAIQLPGPYAVAIMPFAPHSQRLALLAKASNKNVILHLPMEAYSKNHLLGEGALFSHMNDAQIHSALQAALASLPQAIGINNHMGSLLTSERRPMDALMTAIAKHEELFFVDSKTSQRSAARLAAASKGVPAVERHVFLDNEPIRSHIRKQLSRLVTRAKQQGHALAIGHPYPATLATLRKWQPRSFGVKLVSLQEYVKTVHRETESRAR